MYEDNATKKAHLEDFINVLQRIEKEPLSGDTTQEQHEFRLGILRKCIERCRND